MRRRAENPEEAVMVRTLLIVLMAALAFSCATGPASEPPAATGATAPQVQPEAPKKAEPVRKERIEEYKVPVPVKETVVFADGVVDRIVTYEYSEGFKAVLSTTARKPSSPDPIERVSFEYKNGLLAVKSTFGADGALAGKSEYAYGPQGELVGEAIYDGKGSVQSSSEWAWEGGRKASWLVKSAAGAVLAKTEYVYEGQVLKSARLLDGAGNNKGRIEYSYGAGGALTATRYFNASGAPDGRVEYEVKDGKTVKESAFLPDGRLERRVSYEYGPDGSLAKKSLADSSGRAREVSTFENAYRVETRVVVYYE